jgi:hypothetical protein
MIPIYYAVQTCTTKSNQGGERFCSKSRSEITKKCVTSFFQAVKYCAFKTPSIHHIKIIDDQSDPDTVEYLKKLCDKYSCDNIRASFETLEISGIMNSIRECYRYLIYEGTNLGFQVQDDYLFEKRSILEMVDIFYQILNDTGTRPYVSGYHPPHWYYHEEVDKRYSVEPICIIQGRRRYWRQSYNTSCSFLTSIDNYVKHWDLIERFLNSDPRAENLEPNSLNKMFVTRGELMVVPIDSNIFHMQGPAERDRYKHWRPLWNSIKID